MSLVHATSIAWKGQGVLLIGPSGSGKSDLALRLIDRGWALIADDYTQVALRGDRLIGSVPERIAGKMEVRGIGIIDVPHLPEAPIMMVADLGAVPDRLPEPLSWVHDGYALPLIPLRALEPSAPLKLEWAMVCAGLART